jgi:hypothetical protein
MNCRIQRIIEFLNAHCALWYSGGPVRPSVATPLRLYCLVLGFARRFQRFAVPKCSGGSQCGIPPSAVECFHATLRDAWVPAVKQQTHSRVATLLMVGLGSDKITR